MDAHGTGDALAAPFFGVHLGRRDFAAALEHAVGALDAILVATATAGASELALVAA